jgi:hypothetical protein
VDGVSRAATPRLPACGFVVIGVLLPSGPCSAMTANPSALRATREGYAYAKERYTAVRCTPRVQQDVSELASSRSPAWGWVTEIVTCHAGNGHAYQRTMSNLIPPPGPLYPPVRAPMRHLH